MSALERRVQNSIFDIAIIKCFLAPISRLKQIRRKVNMNAVKLTLWMVTITLCIFVLIIYHLYHLSFTRNHHESNSKQLSSGTKRIFDTPMIHIPLDEIYKDIPHHNQDLSIEYEETRRAHMINTPGCTIPVAMVDYKKSIKQKRIKSSCGRRAIFLNRQGIDKVRVVIKTKIMRTYVKKGIDKYRCCYRFFHRATKSGFEHKYTRDDEDITSVFTRRIPETRFSKCKQMEDKDVIFLRHDFINIQCFVNSSDNKTIRVYDDTYAFCKRINISEVTRCGERYNVLILGMDSMSLPRIVQTMNRTVKFLTDKFWPGFRGYHKVGDNTFPNLMAILTGQNLSTIVKTCSQKMDQCNDKLIWTIFKKSGYVTAYGEDYVQLPDIFSKNYIFRRPPTDHYMRPFFLKGEYETKNRTLICTGKTSSGQQLLDYAMNFILTYKEDPYFGFFWMNSFSHNANNHPEEADKMFENFLNRLTYTGALEKTFIIFLSDHGIRFGEHRLKIESYYDNRMPFLFIWPPRKYKVSYPNKLKSILINQFRLITPYDLFDTLLEISELSRCDGVERYYSDPKHQSIFSVISPNRTCQDVAIHDKWCSCHKLYPIDIEDTEGIKGVHFVVSHIQSVIRNVRTKRCWSCMSLSLRNVSRIHFYYDSDKANLYYVVAFSMSPKNIFYEATVLRNDTNMELVGSVSIISAYRGFGDCTIKHEDRVFCVCQKLNDCRLTS